MTRKEADAISVALEDMLAIMEKISQDQEKILAKLEKPAPPEYAPYRAIEL